MRIRARAAGILVSAFVTGGLLVPPAAADPVSYAVDMANATASIAADNAQALLDQATLHPDNISCTVGGWAAAQTPRVSVPGTVTVHAQDRAAGNGVCSDLDAISPQSYTGFVRIRFQQFTTSGTWSGYGTASICRVSSFQGQAPIPACFGEHVFLDPNDPIQNRPRRARFSAGIVRPDGTLDTRSVRFFGPLSAKVCPHFDLSCGI